MDIERQNMDVNLREKISLILHNELKNKWEKERYVVVCMRETRRGRVGVGWWKMRIWKLKGIWGTLIRKCILCAEMRRSGAKF
jgi:hypothetical protein